MTILDTNVLSEPLREVPDGKVVAWLGVPAWRAATLFILTIVGVASSVSGPPDAPSRAAAPRSDRSASPAAREYRSPRQPRPAAPPESPRTSPGPPSPLQKSATPAG